MFGCPPEELEPWRRLAILEELVINDLTVDPAAAKMSIAEQRTSILASLEAPFGSGKTRREQLLDQLSDVQAARANEPNTDRRFALTEEMRKISRQIRELDGNDETDNQDRGG